MKTHAFWIKASFLLLGCFLFVFPTFAQRTAGNGNVIEQSREVASFDIIKVQSGINLYLTQGSQPALTVRADENLMDKIVTKVEGNTLYLDIKGSIRKSKAMDVLVTLKDLKELHASGGSDVYAEDGLKLEELKLFCSGGSDTRLKIEAERLECQTSGGSDAILSGTVNTLMVESSGGSDFNGKKLEAVNCKIQTSGASDVWVHATGEIEMEASGASDIHHTGGAKVVRSRASGGSDIHSN